MDLLEQHRAPIIFAASDAMLTFNNMIVGFVAAGMGPETLAPILLLTSVGNGVADACSWWNSRQHELGNDEGRLWRETALAFSAYLMTSFFISAAFLMNASKANAGTVLVIGVLSAFVLAHLNAVRGDGYDTTAARNTLTASFIGMTCTYGLGKLINDGK